MQTGTLPKQSFWQAVKELDFLSAFFSWFFMLLTRLSEPLMLLSTLYVVAETGVPPIASPALHNVAIGIMITAPELILPGAFVVAARAQRYARWLFAVCCAFVALTLITLVSLFVWHFTGQSLAWLMCARCAAAVGYSILMRVMSHGRSPVQMVSVPDVTERFTEIETNLKRSLAERITENEANITEHLSEHLQRVEANTAVQIIDTEKRMTECFTELLQSFKRTFTEQIERASDKQVTASDLEALHALPVRLEGHAQATQEQMQIMLQELKAALEANAGRPRLSLVGVSPNISPNMSESGFDKAAFVRSCFTEHPEMRNSEIQRKASEQGITISPAYISELRKAFTEEQSA